MRIKVKESILNDVVVGYEDIEPCIIAALALKYNIYLEAGHGLGKTSIAKALSLGVDPTGKSVRYFSAEKAGLIDIGGMPDMKAAEEEGVFKLIPTSKSIFGGKVIVLDELPRANKERMNYWLEILEEGSFQGEDINYDMVVATGNSSTYQGNNQMDSALLSRFMFVLPVSDFTDVTTSQIVQMIKRNRVGGRDNGAIAKNLSKMLKDVKEEIVRLEKSDDFNDQIDQFIATFIKYNQDFVSKNDELRENIDAWLCPREYATLLPKAILGLTAYFNTLGYKDQSIKMAGQYAIKYCIETRHSAAGDDFIKICNDGWRQLNGLLSGDIGSPRGKIEFKYAMAMSPAEKVEFWRNNMQDAINLLDGADILEMASSSLSEIKNNDIGQIAPLWRVFNANPKTQHVSNTISGFVITELARKIDFAHSNMDAPTHLKTLVGKSSGQTSIDATLVGKILEASENE